MDPKRAASGSAQRCFSPLAWSPAIPSVVQVHVASSSSPVPAPATVAAQVPTEVAGEWAAFGRSLVYSEEAWPLLTRVLSVVAGLARRCLPRVGEQVEPPTRPEFEQERG